MTISADVSLRQAPMTIRVYLDEAIDSIDKKMGNGYAKNHPELVGAFINACAHDYFASRIETMHGETNRQLEEISNAIDKTGGI